jgi:hypothetical protein
MKVQDLVEAVIIALVLGIIALYLYASHARFE